MPHNEWCGFPCCECLTPCTLDQSIPCSPDCPNLAPNGDFTNNCKDCDVYLNFIEDERRFYENFGDGSEIGCKDCPDDECTGHCMSCAYRSL